MSGIVECYLAPVQIERWLFAHQIELTPTTSWLSLFIKNIFLKYIFMLFINIALDLAGVIMPQANFLLLISPSYSIIISILFVYHLICLSACLSSQLK